MRPCFPEEEGNGSEEGSLSTPGGLGGDWRVPETGWGEFHPAIPSGKMRASVDLRDLLLMFPCGMERRQTKRMTETI
ncbi:MAG: hypothetical protein ACUVRX_05710 [Actinomycetota bacterium]